MCRCNFRSWRADLVCVPNRNLQGSACNPFAWPWGADASRQRDEALGSLVGSAAMVALWPIASRRDNPSAVVRQFVSSKKRATSSLYPEATSTRRQQGRGALCVSGSELLPCMAEPWGHAGVAFPCRERRGMIGVDAEAMQSGRLEGSELHMEWSCAARSDGQNGKSLATDADVVEPVDTQDLKS